MSWLQHAEGLAFPEGPVVLPDNSLAVVEIAAGRVSHIDNHGKLSIIAKPNGGPNGAALGPDGHLYICNCGGFRFIHTKDGRRRPVSIADNYSGGRIERINLATGRVETLYVSCAGTILNAPNDIVFDRQGGFWFTDHGHLRGRSLDMGAVYYARTDGSEIKEVAFPLLTPNGIGLSPDGARLYVSETLTGRLKIFATGPEPGRLSSLMWAQPKRPAIPFAAPYRFDSMAIEADGAIAIASLGQSGIVVLSSEGEFVEEIRFPDPFTTNICFGGDDMRDAYVTQSSTGTLLKQRWKRPGLRLTFAPSLRCPP